MVSLLMRQRNHHFLCSGKRNMMSVIFFDQNERKINRRSKTGRRIERSILNKWPSVIEAQFWKAPRDIAGISPMSGYFTSIQQSRGSQAINAAADYRHTPCSNRACEKPVRNLFSE